MLPGDAADNRLTVVPPTRIVSTGYAAHTSSSFDRLLPTDPPAHAHSPGPP
jgi:hypothetical protein